MTKRSTPAVCILLFSLLLSGLACRLGTPDGAGTPSAAPPTPDEKQATSAPQLWTPIPTYVQGESANAIQAAIYALAVYLSREPGAFSPVSAYETQFSDSALGCPRDGETPREEITPGYTVILTDGAREYEVHTSQDGLHVRCLSSDLQPGASPGNTGIIATITALENREYGTLASLLPSTVAISTYPEAEQSITSSTFVAQLRDIWLGPADLQVDLNTNVLALMPSLVVPADQIPVYSTGWGGTRDTDGILFFDLSGAAPTLSRLMFIPVGQKALAYRASTPEPEKEEEGDTGLSPLFQNGGFSIQLPMDWITSTTGSLVNLHPPGEEPVITLGPWSSPEGPREGQSFRSWIETTIPDLIANLDSLNSLEPVWAASGQPGYRITWNVRRGDGALEPSNPLNLYEYHQTIDDVEYYALALTLLNPNHSAAFEAIASSLTIDQLVGVPSDMHIYRHDELGFRIQYPADWTLLPSPLGAAFQPPEGEVAVSVGPWILQDGPAPNQSFGEWVASAPAEGIPNYGLVEKITPIEAADADTGFLATWQTYLTGGGLGTSDPAAIFPLHRQIDETSYHALAINLHVLTETLTFERMIATLVIERMDAAEMVFVPAGSFVRGSSDEQISAWTSACGSSCRSYEFTDEAPQRAITLDSYFIDRTEVTVAQFKEFVDNTGYLTTAEQKGDAVQYTWRAFDAPDRQNHPVRWMTWDDANAYCQWAGKRLPTEAEWEKAARGEDGRTWPWGNSWDDARVPHGDTAPVDGFANGASPYGALGMAGNVWEWVADWYEALYYGASPDSNPLGPAPSNDKVLRGGGFNNVDWALQSANRHHGGVQGYSNDHGFRCAADG
jgi:formylglycine-generating enzyme required for sulfatase activity